MLGPPTFTYSTQKHSPSKMLEGFVHNFANIGEVYFFPILEQLKIEECALQEEHSLYSNFVIRMLKVVNFLQILMGSWAVRFKNYNFFF